MKHITHSFGKLGFMLLCAVFMSSTTSATTFTALVSGNFYTSATWGGSIPNNILSTDVVIIPTGITVTLDNNITLSNSSSLIVNGTLSSGIHSSALILSGGSLSGSGTINVNSLNLNASSGFGFSGSLTAQHATSTGTTIGSAATININEDLSLDAGILNNAAANIIISNGAVININGGILNITGNGSIDLTASYDVHYSNASAYAGVELSGSGLHDITINIPTGIVSLSDDLAVTGMLTISAGMLNLNGHNLSLSGMADVNISAGAGISSNTASDISIMTSNGLSGSLVFATGGNSVKNLTINTGNNNATVSLGSDLTVSGTLQLQSGRIVLNTHNLQLGATATVNGGSSSSYVVTNGNGRLMMTLTSGNSAMFTIGTTDHYAPAIVFANSGSASGIVGVTVMNKVYSMGMTGVAISDNQPVVAATWDVTSSAAAAIDYKLQVMWDASMEVNGLNHNEVYISHYTAGSWDMTATAAATANSNGMLMLERDHITSLSPFAVAGKNAIMTDVNVIAATGNTIKVYPNPATSTLYIDNSLHVKSVAVYNMTGSLVKYANDGANSISVQDLPSGNYYIKLVSESGSASAKFVKD